MLVDSLVTLIANSCKLICHNDKRSCYQHLSNRVPVIVAPLDYLQVVIGRFIRTAGFSEELVNIKVALIHYADDSWNHVLAISRLNYPIAEVEDYKKGCS